MIAVESSTGIGAGLIDRGTLLRGMKGTAGRHWTHPHSTQRRFSVYLRKQGVSRCLEWRTGNCKVPYVVELPGNGNLAAIGALRQAGNDIGGSYYDLHQSFRPRLIPVGGRLATASDHLVAHIKEVVYTICQGRPDHRLFTEPLRVGAGLAATEFALERENLGGLLPSETKKQFKKVLDLKSGIHSSYEPCSAVSGRP
jgi:predicted NBD/HSP70 family sugar kinase